MKKILLVTVLFTSLAMFTFAQEEIRLPRVSQKSSVMQTIGLTDVTITYSRPGVKGRTVWGGLVPYDRVWRTGANEATTITFSQDVKINGQPLPAGTYGLHTIPAKSEWTIIFNKQADQWGSYSYDESKDALRVKAISTEGPHVEWMKFGFPDVTLTSGTVQLAWEKVRVPFTVETDTVNQSMAGIQKALSGEVKDWRTPYRAADFVFSNNLPRKEEAMKWIEQSTALKETYWNMRLKAALLAEAGKTADAIAVAEKAVQIGKAGNDEPGEIAKTEKLIADWKSAVK